MRRLATGPRRGAGPSGRGVGRPGRPGFYARASDRTKPVPRGPSASTSRSSRATPRSSAARRSWSSPASRATVPGRREPRRRGPAAGPDRAADDAEPGRPDVRRPRRVGRRRPLLSRRVRRPEHRDLPRPRLRVPRARAHRRPARLPAYTALEPKTVEDIRHVTAVEGTELTLLCRLNKDVADGPAGRREGRGDRRSRRDEDGGHVYRATFTLADSHRYRVQLVDRDGRRNKLTPRSW